MPILLERKLKREAKRRGYGKRRTSAYVYGTLRTIGWKPKGSPGSTRKRRHRR